MEFSVIVATRDRERYLRDALESLQAQAGAPDFEVIVVDNGSSDGTRSAVERHTGVPSIRYVWAPEPNRGRARNRGVEEARGRYVLFCDDDVVVPAHWIAAHAAAHRGTERVVNGPILNVPSNEFRPKPRASNYSRAFLCTCNASVAKDAFVRAGGFDESFDLYGWEDTELGVRLRAAGLRHAFAWNAYLWHVKPPRDNTIAVESRKAVEKARMARRFVTKHPSRRARLATGAHPLNVLRGRYLLPDWLLAVYAGVSTSDRAPAWLATLGRTQLLDGIYTRELVRALDADDA